MVTIRQIITYLSFFDLLQPRAEDAVVQIILAKTDSAVDNPKEQGAVDSWQHQLIESYARRRV